MTPRFVFFQTDNTSMLWYVIDTQAPNTDPMEAVPFGTFSRRAQAEMVCMSLNGQVGGEKV